MEEKYVCNDCGYRETFVGGGTGEPACSKCGGKHIRVG